MLNVVDIIAEIYMKSKSRIGILDSFRCIAVMMVVLYHYFAGGNGLTNFIHLKINFLFFSIWISRC